MPQEGPQCTVGEATPAANLGQYAPLVPGRLGTLSTMDQSADQFDRGVDQYVPLPVAAERLGLSSLAVRRRCQRGTLDGQKRGGEWYVRLTGPSRPEGPVPDRDGPAHDQDEPARRDGPARPGTAVHAARRDMAELVALLERTIERASAAEQAAAMWQERARNLETQVEQLLALPAHEEPERPGRRWRWPWRKEG